MFFAVVLFIYPVTMGLREIYVYLETGAARYSI